MSQCFKCGRKGAFLKVYHCARCGKAACDTCYTLIPTIDPGFFTRVKNEQFNLSQSKKELLLNQWLAYPPNSSLNMWVYLCSGECAKYYMLNQKAMVLEYVRDRKELYIPVKVSINPHISLPPENDPRYYIDRWIIKQSLLPHLQPLFDEVVSLTDPHKKNLTEREIQLGQARNFELAYRNEEAAKIYEALGLWAEAGRVRKKAQETITKNLTVDVNKLLEQLREGHVATTYNCTNCGAGINVDGKTDANGLRFCNFCGSAIQIHDLVNVIQKVL